MCSCQNVFPVNETSAADGAWTDPEQDLPRIGMSWIFNLTADDATFDNNCLYYYEPFNDDNLINIH